MSEVRGNAESVKWLVIFHMDCLMQTYLLRKEKAMNALVYPKISFVGPGSDIIIVLRSYSDARGAVNFILQGICDSWVSIVSKWALGNIRRHVSGCYLAPSGLRCLHIFCPPLRAPTHIVGEVISLHFPAGDGSYRIRFELKLLADQGRTNICLSASIAQVEVGDNLPNKNKSEFCRDTHLKCPCFCR